MKTQFKTDSFQNVLTHWSEPQQTLTSLFTSSPSRFHFITTPPRQFPTHFVSHNHNAPSSAAHYRSLPVATTTVVSNFDLPVRDP